MTIWFSKEYWIFHYSHPATLLSLARTYLIESLNVRLNGWLEREITRETLVVEQKVWWKTARERKTAAEEKKTRINYNKRHSLCPASETHRRAMKASSNPPAQTKHFSFLSPSYSLSLFSHRKLFQFIPCDLLPFKPFLVSFSSDTARRSSQLKRIYHQELFFWVAKKWRKNEMS